MAKKLTGTVLKDMLSSVDDVSNYKGITTFRKGYFYTMGMNQKTYQQLIHDQLNASNIQFEPIACGNHYANFRGGDSVRQGSHFWVQVKLV